MNVAEKLAREISRVTALRCQYEGLRNLPKANVEPAIAMMSAVLEAACLAAGVEDALTQMNALEKLGRFTE